MEVIDDDGRLFGAVNVIDALVVLLIVAVLIAGAVFVLSPGADADTRYATVDLGEQPNYVVEQVDTGDVMEVEGHADNLTITDVYHGPDGHLLTRVEVTGERIDVGNERSQFQFAGESFRPGQAIAIETIDYEVEGNVTSVDQDGPQLTQEQTEVFTVANISGSTAISLEAGDTYEVNDQTVATIESVLIYPGEDNEHTALLGLSLSTYDQVGTPQFGESAVRLGNAISFETNAYNFDAEILRFGAALDVDTEDVVIETTVPRSTAEQIESGDSYTVGGAPVATVQTVDVYPTSDRDRMRVHLGVEIPTWQAGERTMFGHDELRPGTSIPLDTANYVLDGNVSERGALTLSGENTTTEVTVQKQEVASERADRIQVGMSETVRGDQVAAIVSKEEAPAEVVLESEDGDIHLQEHPTDLDVELTAELELLWTETGVQFHGEEIREGDTLVLDLGTIFIEVELVEIHQ